MGVCKQNRIIRTNTLRYDRFLLHFWGNKRNAKIVEKLNKFTGLQIKRYLRLRPQVF